MLYCPRNITRDNLLLTKRNRPDSCEMQQNETKYHMFYTATTNDTHKSSVRSEGSKICNKQIARYNKLMEHLVSPIELVNRIKSFFQQEHFQAPAKQLQTLHSSDLEIHVIVDLNSIINE